jgi:hypothetical protein
VKEQNHIVHRSLDKILITQRNTKMFLISMTGPFFLFIKVVEYVLKYGILLWMWYKKKNAAPVEGAVVEATDGQAEAAAVLPEGVKEGEDPV